MGGETTTTFAEQKNEALDRSIQNDQCKQNSDDKQIDCENTKPATLIIDDRNSAFREKPFSPSNILSDSRSTTPAKYKNISRHTATAKTDANGMVSASRAASEAATVGAAAAAATRPPKDNWDKITAVAPIISGMLIFLMGGFFTYAFNQQQLRLQEIQTIEKFIPHLMGNEQSKKAAILAMSQLTNPELAGKFAGIFASTGTVSALQSMVENGNAHEKNIATKALSDALERLAARENKLTAIQAEYQQALQTKSSEPNGDPDYMHNLSQLGEVYKLQGESSLAEPLLKKSLAAREKLYGSDNPQVAEALRSLAELYQMNGNSAEAANYLKRARTIEAKFAPAQVKQENEVPVPPAQNHAPQQQHEPAPAAEVEKPKIENLEKTPAAPLASEAKAAQERNIRYVEAAEESRNKVE